MEEMALAFTVVTHDEAPGWTFGGRHRDEVLSDRADICCSSNGEVFDPVLRYDAVLQGIDRSQRGG
jgi:hypothetical protein